MTGHTRYTPEIDVEAMAALDVHVHVESSLDPSRPRPRRPFPVPDLREIAGYYRAARIACVVFPVDAEPLLGPAVPNDEIVDFAADNADVMIPFASLNPLRGPECVDEATRLVSDRGVAGFKFHPGFQQFFPNDERAYPLYAELERLGVPALFHTGQVAGASSVRLKHCDPIHLDDVAADFPDLRIIMAHPSFPWQDVALSIAHRRPHVFIDLSGWSPKHFPPQLTTYANSLISEKVLFGSDFPVLTPERWMDDFALAPFRDAVRPGILKNNAARLLQLPTR